MHIKSSKPQNRIGTTSMHKILIGVYFTLFTLQNLSAKVQVVVKDTCHLEESILDAKHDFLNGKSLGFYSISSLDKNSIEYLGNERGINSIAQTPTGNEAIKIISDNEMYA